MTTAETEAFETAVRIAADPEVVRLSDLIKEVQADSMFAGGPGARRAAYEGLMAKRAARIRELMS